MAAQKFLIVDENSKPLAWHENDKQLCYCTTNEWQDEPHPATAYVKEDALRYIKKTKANRKRWKMDVGHYFLMPFK